VRRAPIPQAPTIDVPSTLAESPSLVSFKFRTVDTSPTVIFKPADGTLQFAEAQILSTDLEEHGIEQDGVR